jgi:hypothetical protein
VFDIVLWSEPANWNDLTHRPVSVSQTPVTITMSGTAGNVAVYNPLVGTKPVARARDVNEIAVGLTDHPVIIEVRPTRDRLLTAASTTADGGSVN